MILLVENDPLLAESVYHLLEMHGYAVSVASDGKQALAQMTWQTPELIISDWHMPNMNGMDFCKAVRYSANFGAVPIILISGMAPWADLNVPFDVFIQKPFRLATLIDEIGKLLHTAPRLQGSNAGNSERV